MKRLIISLLFLPQLVFAQYNAKCFGLDATADTKQVIVRQTITEDAEIPFGVRTPISGLSVSGRVVFENDDDSYVRVIMKDDYNYEHLVYENYPLLADGMSVDFQNIAIETKRLDGITPSCVRVELKNATLVLESLSYVGTSGTKAQAFESETVLKKEQSQYIVDRLNENLAKHDKTWRAGMTSVAEKTFEEKKAMFGGKLPQLYGFEYYAGGIFVMPGALKSAEHNRTRSVTSSPYVSEWDWRNRHGKNWMTCVKNQGNCGSCWAHASLAALEAYINLYYNRILNYSLSVEELISCIDTGNPDYTVGCEGGHEYVAYNYIKNNGVVDSICFPYVAANRPCSLKCSDPTERIFIENFIKYGTHNQITEGIVKNRLFKSPIPLCVQNWIHAITLAGYKTIQDGDVLYWENLYHNYTITISTTSHQDLIGNTAWLIKNSWGTSWGNNGYGYVVMDVSAITDDHYCVDGKITSLIYSDSDIICSDADGDGYYFWGPGAKPSHCPSWVPNTPDGDDSNINYGPIDAYGNLQSLPAGTTIKTAVTYNSNNTITQHLGVVSGGIITVKATSTMSGNGKIRVCEGGKLIVDGGTLQNADLELVPGSQVTIKNNGKINMASGKTFDAPEGVVVDIPYGSIN